MLSIVILALTVCFAEDPTALIFAAMLHEAAHLALGLLFFSRLPELSFSLCGLRMTWEGNGRAAEDILLSVAGPGVNLLMWILLPKDSILAAYSLSLAVFNLLPAKGLDGGEIIKNLSRCLLGIRAEEKICAFVTAAAVGSVFFLNCAVQLTAQPNLPLLFVTLFLIIRTYGK